ncbi:conserved hypothetical protein [Bosea sp. 62]|nr:conserved hypothetical protein [Bosea sp. 21B]CAD5289430.1 conserved hypothetical protein [Bosea sp. 46]CAD5301161.1 conserved hypothetical protein [Bosea sp. 7B]VVT60507.1 conserved hypothetical protein [Bosea sp. EC-HK365B]VXB03026.1 conserved hypothetical protein [Bosea sp. 62]VXB64417.1 conserved hypothetical protein [Bosea sp. 127]VXC61441.1 conserved hypothetical protein [Bosea sp. 29B]VXC93223.1 conserved hypothetical protein [Bosea sp. 125]
MFCWEGPSYTRPWKTYSLVITADCDLERKKTRGIISYIPALITEDYIWHFWKDSKFESTIEKTIKKFVKKINSILMEKEKIRTEISELAAISWLERVGIDQLIDELNIADNGQRLSLKALTQSVLELRELSTKMEPDINLLRKCYPLKNAKATSETDSELALEFQSSVSSLPGDVFHIPHVESEPDDGIFLMLRHISQCNISDIALKPSDLQSGEAKARRVGRIAAPYKFAIMQNLARVFTDIGLPNSYQDRCKSTSTRFFERIA